MNRIRIRPRGVGRSATAYDADAQAYIAATGALFPEALNALVLGIKAAGLWDDHLGSLKLAIGVPTLAASLVDLRNPAFNATAVNAPGHSATAGWSFLQASSQYIDDPWGPGIANGKAAQNDAHFGRRVKQALNAGGSTTRSPGMINAGAVNFGFQLLEPDIQVIKLNDNANLSGTSATNYTGHFIGSRVGAGRAFYRNGASVASDTQASTGVFDVRMPIGARNVVGFGVDGFFTGRISAQHGGAGLEASQAAALTGLIDAYATAVGET